MTGTGPDDAPMPATDDTAPATDDTAPATVDTAPAADEGAPAKPRPSTSATSRARRIGGGTVPSAPRPAAPEPTPSVPDDGPTPRFGRRSRAAAAAAAAEPGSEPTVRPGRTARTADPTPAVSTTKTLAGTPATAPPDTAASPDATGPRRTVPSWAAWAPAVAFFVVAAVFLALLLVDRLGSDDSSSTSSKQRQTVLAAAKNCVAATNTYKYTNVDAYEAAGVKCTTGQYSTQYSTAMNTLIKKNAPLQQFTQIAQVSTAGVESVSKSGKQWTVLLYGQLNITNKSTPKGRVDPFGLVATMSQVKGAWVIERIQLLSSIS